MDREAEVRIKFGQILKKFREERGKREGKRKMSQFDFASSCGIEPSYYGKVELGKHNISLVQCWKIAEALNISLAELFADMQD